MSRVLGGVRQRLAAEADTMVPPELVRTAAAEHLAHRVQILQFTGAAAIDRQNTARTGEPESRFGPDVPGGGRPEFRTTEEFLRAPLGSSGSEAHRRIDVGGAIAERTSLTGAPLAPVLPVLAGAAQAGEISAKAA